MSDAPPPRLSTAHPPSIAEAAAACAAGMGLTPQMQRTCAEWHRRFAESCTQHEDAELAAYHLGIAEALAQGAILSQQAENERLARGIERARQASSAAGSDAARGHSGCALERRFDRDCAERMTRAA
jgi:hypothetical protein